jgi:hypothetical protein
VVKTDEKYWKPTPPEFREALEPHWGMLKTMILDSSSQYLTPDFYEYSTDSNSLFYQQNLDVYLLCKNLTSEQKEIALFWDDNLTLTPM